MDYSSDEVTAALRWYRSVQSTSGAFYIRRAMRNLDALGLDSFRVILAAYKYHTKQMADTVPYTRGN